FVPVKFFVLSKNIKLVLVVFVIFGLLWAAWKYVHFLRLPATWPWLLLYSGIIVIVTQCIEQASKLIDDTVPVQVEVLILSFILGCMLARAPGEAGAARNAQGGPGQALDGPREQLAATIVSACFMLLVGLSLPHFTATSSEVAREETMMANKF